MEKFGKALTRQNLAYVLMVIFVVCTSLGVAMIFPPAGLIVLGVTSGLYAYLLGSN